MSASFSKSSNVMGWQKKVKFCFVCALSHFSPIRLFATLWTGACQAPLSMEMSDKNIGVGCHALLQGIFLTQASNTHLLGLLH